MKKFVLAGFEPFSELWTNPSQLIVKLFSSKIYQDIFLDADWDITHFILPLEKDATSYQEFLGEIANQKPDVVIIFGAAIGRTCISVEEFAYNRFSDTGGHPEDAVQIYSNLSPQLSYHCTVNIEGIIRGLRKCGIPAESSRDPGLYYCNYAACRTANLIHSYALRTRFGLIHLPPTSEEVAGNPLFRRTPSLPQKTIIDAARIICNLA